VLVGGLDIHMGRGNFQGEKGLAQDMSGSQYTQSKLSRGSIGMVWIPIRVTRWSAHWHHLANIIIIIIIIRTFVTSAVSANILNLRRKTTQHCKASACNGDTSAPATFVRNRLKSSTSTSSESCTRCRSSRSTRHCTRSLFSATNNQSHIISDRRRKRDYKMLINAQIAIHKPLYCVLSKCSTCCKLLLHRVPNVRLQLKTLFKQAITNK